MRERLRRLVAAAPADTWFFLSVSALALVFTVGYWFWTYEQAGSVLLLGFSIATGVMGSRLLLGHPPGRPSPASTGAIPGVAGLDTSAAPGLSDPDADRPFLDESGRLPTPTLAPLAVAFAVALLATSIILGPWLIIAAALPLGWGAIGWLRDASAEFRAIDRSDGPGSARTATRMGGTPETMSAPPTATLAEPRSDAGS